MSTKGVTPEQDEIVSEIQIAAPPARVFKALTDPGELKQWFSSPDCPVKMWEMDPRLDGAYRYSTEKGSIIVNGVSEFECHGHLRNSIRRAFSLIPGTRTGTTIVRAALWCAGNSRLKKMVHT